MQGVGAAERTATEVHSTLCALVTTQAAASSAWSEYESILLDAETQAFFAARLAQGGSGGGPSQPPKRKKRRTLRDGDDDDDDEAEDEDAAAVASICEHCGGAVPEVSLRVACMDGTTLEVAVAQRGLVREVKRLVGQVRTRLLLHRTRIGFSSPRLVALSVARHGPGPDRALRRRH
jgi:hypothetical protein